MGTTVGAGTILIAEDEPEVRSYLEMALRCQGYSVILAENGDEALEAISTAERPISAVLLDIIMPERDGMDTLREIRRSHPEIPVIMMSCESSPPRVTEAIRSGAADFLGKPIAHGDLEKAIRKALTAATAPPVRPGTNGVAKSSSRCFLPYYSAELKMLLARIGPADVPVLITGETGTGKEIFARQIHLNSSRANGPFVKLNCAALPSELVESELFGYERGAFTGAFQKKPGMFEIADGGTLLLDEIGDMDIKLQAKLLQVLQDQEFRRIGGKETIRVNVRVIAATHRELEDAIAESRFREDLYYRLNIVSVQLPALRHCRDAIVPLGEFLLRKHTPVGMPVPEIKPELAESLEQYRWPGNVRELENVMRRLLVFADASLVVQDLRVRSRMRTLAAGASAAAGELPAASAPLEEVNRKRQQAEAEVILDALQRTRWNRKEAAALLKTDYKALLYKMKKLRIEESDGRWLQAAG